MSHWNKQCEEILNKQINLEYWASYQYDYMWSYFDRDDVGLVNIAEYFKKAANEEREHAHKFIEYQNMRGGKVLLTNIENVDLNFLCASVKNQDVLLSYKKALEMEEKVYNHLLELHKVADDCKDPQFTDFIEGTFLNEQIEAMNEIKKYISQLNRIGENGHGVWDFGNSLSVGVCVE